MTVKTICSQQIGERKSNCVPCVIVLGDLCKTREANQTSQPFSLFYLVFMQESCLIFKLSHRQPSASMQKSQPYSITL